LQGEASFFDMEVDCLRMEDVLAEANWKMVAFQIKEKDVQVVGGHEKCS
jgi:hypothetical protein